jgi:hypothetical protein
VVAALRDRDPVQGAVELAVAGAVEPVTLAVAARGRQRCGAGVHRQASIICKALAAGDLADQLRGREDAAAGQLEQRWRLGRDQERKLTLELALAPRELDDPEDELTRDPRLHRLLPAAEAIAETIEPATAIETAGRQLKFGLELVQVPTQAVLRPRALADQVLAVVEQQPDLAPGTLQRGRRQRRLAQRRPRDRHRVDRVRLAALPRRAARPRHQLRRHPHHPLAAREQETLERDRDVPAILQRPQPLPAQRARPAKQLLVAPTASLHRPLATHLARPARKGGGAVALLVRINSDYDHSRSPFTEVATDRRQRTGLSGGV